MLKFGSKSDVTVVHRATIRLFDDNEIIYCDFQVRRSRASALPPSFRSVPPRYAPRVPRRVPLARARIHPRLFSLSLAASSSLPLLIRLSCALSCSQEYRESRAEKIRKLVYTYRTIVQSPPIFRRYFLSLSEKRWIFLLTRFRRTMHGNAIRRAIAIPADLDDTTICDDQQILLTLLVILYIFNF